MSSSDTMFLVKVFASTTLLPSIDCISELHSATASLEWLSGTHGRQIQFRGNAVSKSLEDSRLV